MNTYCPRCAAAIDHDLGGDFFPLCEKCNDSLDVLEAFERATGRTLRAVVEQGEDALDLVFSAHEDEPAADAFVLELSESGIRAGYRAKSLLEREPDVTADQHAAEIHELTQRLAS